MQWLGGYRCPATSVCLQSKHIFFVLFRKHSSEGKHWGKNRISWQWATYKMEPVFVSQKSAHWRRSGREEEIRSAVHLFGKSNLNQTLREWHCCQSMKGTNSKMFSLWKWDDWRLLDGSLGSSYAAELIWVFFMLVIPGAQASIRFRRRCSSGRGSSIHGIWAIKVECQKTELHKRRRECWKEAFCLGQECVSWLTWNFLNGVSQERLLPKGACVCPFQWQSMGDDLTQLLSFYLET